MPTNPDYFVVLEPTEGKLKSLTLEEKIKLIDQVEGGRSVKDVAEEHGVNRNTLHYILKNRSKIRDNISANPGISTFKRIKQVSWNFADRANLTKFLLDKVTGTREANPCIHGYVAYEGRKVVREYHKICCT